MIGKMIFSISGFCHYYFCIAGSSFYKRINHLLANIVIHYSTYLSRIISVPKDVCEYRQWVKTSYEPSEFIPKTVYTTVTTPIFQVGAPTQYVSTNNGRPPLLPTPPSPFSPRVNIMTPPFSPYPATTSYGFFEGNPIQQTILLSNVNTNESGEIVSTQMSPLQLNPPAEMVHARAPQQVHYVVPATYTHSQHKMNETRHQSFPSSTQMHSPVKSPNNINSAMVPLSNVLTSMVQQRRNNSSNSFTSNKINGNSYYANKRGNSNSGSRNSQRNSPKASPELKSREFSSAPVIADCYNRITEKPELRGYDASPPLNVPGGRTLETTKQPVPAESARTPVEQTLHTPRQVETVSRNIESLPTVVTGNVLTSNDDVILISDDGESS